MSDDDRLAADFEQHRRRLHAIARRVLGSPADADDAVQETWLRLRRTGDDDIDELGAWLTTVVSRVCLNLLRTRTNRREDDVDPHVLLGSVVSVGAALPSDPADVVASEDSVGKALQVVLGVLAPAERLAFVLHDLFAVPFAEIAATLDRTPEAARQLASRARRRVRGVDAAAHDPAAQRQVVAAFFDAARGGDLERLTALLHPDVVLRSDGGTALPAATTVVAGAPDVARRAAMFARPTATPHPAVVGGLAGVVVVEAGRAVAVMAFVVTDGQVVAIDAVVDPDRTGRIGPDAWAR